MSNPLDSALVKDVNRLSHLTKDVQDFVALTMFSKPSHWSCSRSNFGKKRHDFLFRHSSTTSLKPAPANILEKDIARVQHLRPDIQDFVLTTLSSDVSLQFPEKLLNRSRVPSPHDFLFRRKKSTALKVKPTPKAPATSTPLYSTDAQIKGKLIRDRILFGSKTTPKFSLLFPQTSWPNITFINGHPTIDRDLFNKLLTSRLRAAKSAIKVDGTSVPHRFSPSLLKEFQRMINLSIRLEFDVRVLTPTRKRNPVKPTRKSVQSQMKQRFQTSQPTKDEKLSSTESQTSGLHVPEHTPTLSKASALAIADDPLPSRAFSLKYAVSALCEASLLGTSALDGKDDIVYFPPTATSALAAVKKAEQVSMSYFRYIKSRFPELTPYHQHLSRETIVRSTNEGFKAPGLRQNASYPMIRQADITKIQSLMNYYVRTCNILGSVPLPDFCPDSD
jgi:hypothetical protein